MSLFGVPHTEERSLGHYSISVGAEYTVQYATD